MKEDIIAANNAAGRIGEETIAAFVAEPVTAVGGILLRPATYFPRIKATLDRQGILLVTYYVICALGRLGHCFGYKTTNVQPDTVSLAKGLQAGHPVATAAALADIDFIGKNSLLDRTSESGAFLLQNLKNASQHITVVVNVRGRGMLIGMQLARLDASEVSCKCLGLGLIGRALVGHNTVALAPPLIVTRANVLTVVETILQALSSSQQ
ncbi:guanine deaminase [Penicillium atrosanguineum]|uniref:Uncharacterized protein n=1 Tax=Penicillium atrosanguineum TaxID=1132637 RepID=A0A9W9PNA4_9EURO|nr:guanine deaminase [Penicillium atrosanguineum]KAJ5296476.1 guanine deaminase [Penicillium atrosanguineum]KAJ5299244.1 hypothetical protein N7476_010801 [Penicillium atrosanguineum]